MRQWILALCVSLALCGGVCQAAAPVATHAVVAGQVDPPQDAAVPYLTVAGKPGQGGFEALRFAFRVNPQLQQLAGQTHFRILSVLDPIYAERYANEFDELPAVRLQQADGVVLYEASGAGIPQIDRLTEELTARVADVRCIRREEHQADKYDVAPPKVAQPVVKKSVPHGVPLWQVIVLCFFGSLAGWAASGFKTFSDELHAK